jgi:hypothetical protein
MQGVNNMEEIDLGSCLYSTAQVGDHLVLYFGRDSQSEGYGLCELKELDEGSVAMIVEALNETPALQSRINMLETQNLLLRTQLAETQKKMPA